MDLIKKRINKSNKIIYAAVHSGKFSASWAFFCLNVNDLASKISLGGLAVDHQEIQLAVGCECWP